MAPNSPDTYEQSTPPFIIWTLRRTGGTNLANGLFERSPFPAAQHEPFNVGREYSGIIATWRDSQNSGALNQALTTICERGTLLKHCVEVCPPEISEELADTTTRAGYKHLFLYRRNALDRLLSLHFARSTGIWGPTPKQMVDRSAAHGFDETLERLLPIAELALHESECVARLTDIWHRLVAGGAAPMGIAYEDIYANGHERAESVLLHVLSRLGLSIGVEADVRFIADVCRAGDQGTRGKYRDFHGVADLAKTLEGVPQFAPWSGACIRSEFPNVQHPWIRHAVFDVIHTLVGGGQSFELGGVVVLSAEAAKGCTLRLETKGGEFDVTWGISSPRMKRSFPDTLNSANARFKVRNVQLGLGDVARLRLDMSNGYKIYVASVLRQDG